MSPGRNRPVAGHRFGKAETGVRSAVAAPSLNSQLCTRGETADAAASEAAALAAWRFKSSRVHQYFCSLRKAAKASVLHTDIPGSSPGASTKYFSRSPKAERPADNRKTAVRYRAGEPTHTTIKQTGRLAAAPPSLMDPERSSLSRLGNGLLIRAQEVQLLPGPPTASCHAHD
jgi:hypothetical protein